MMIELTDVCLRFPVIDHVAHSFQRAMYSKLGGMLGYDAGARIRHVDALRNITLRVREGERLGIIGHNGAGKTSLLRVITGAYIPTGGTVRREGRVSALTDITLGMDVNATGRKNILFRLVFMGHSFREAKKSVDEIIDFSGLGEFIDLPVRTYSSGMFLRLAFAISTHFVPDILVLDEVIGAGDLDFQQKAQGRIQALFDKSRVMILAAHDLGSIQTHCNRAVILSRGSIIGEGSPQEMVEQYTAVVADEMPAKTA